MTHPSRPAQLRHNGRRALSFALTLVAVVTLVGAWGGGTAEAAAYRFWSYWTGGSDWSFSSQGASRRPPDGGVDGWRFSISPDSASAIAPRQNPSFDRLCGGTPEQDGHKRVGLVIDFGTTQDAPDGESPPRMIATCAVVPDDANGYEVLTTVGQLRIDDGLICGINGYPATECGTPVSDPQPSEDPEQGGGDGDGDNGSNQGDQGTPGGDGSGEGAGVNAGTPTTDPSSPDKKRDKPNADQSEKGESGSAAPDPEATDQTTSAATAVEPTAGTPGKGSPVGVLAGIAVIAAIGAAAFMLARRRR